MSLFEQACEVRLNAHAPYSGFKVGAALRVSSGKTFVGCNVENAAYPEGTCAEAGAIAAMVAAGESQIEEIFIVAGGSEPISPCGGCRQKISEFSRPIRPSFLPTRTEIRCTKLLGNSYRILSSLPTSKNNGRTRNLGKGSGWRVA